MAACEEVLIQQQPQNQKEQGLLHVSICMQGLLEMDADTGAENEWVEVKFVFGA